MNAIATTAQHREAWQRRRVALEKKRQRRLSARALAAGQMSPLDRFLPTLVRGLKLAGVYRRGVANACDVQVVEHELFFNALPPSFDGYRILHLTDPHIDSLPGIEDSICERLAPLRYDMAVLTGDYRFRTYGTYGPAVRLPLQQIISTLYAPDGIYATLGNHDTHDAVSVLEDMGARPLVNEHLRIQRGSEAVTFSGIDDPHYYYTPEATQALEQTGPGFKVALVHSPELYQEAAAAGYQFYLCGHTHGGQICLPGGAPILRNLHRGRHLVHGLWQQEDMVGYTSAGCGVSGMPVRFFSRGEVTVFTLRKREQASG